MYCGFTMRLILIKRLLILMITLLSPFVSAQTVDVLCTEAFCEEQTVQSPCDDLPKECSNDTQTINGIFMLDPSICNCCEFCLVYLGEGDDCVRDGTGQPVYESICGPGLMCERVGTDESATCIPLVTDCINDQKAYDKAKEDGTLGFTEIRPLCDARGDYSSVHCIGGLICYCVNPEGQRIFGEKVYTSSNVPESMDCECSLAAWKAEQLAIEAGVYSQPIHCLEDGSYDQLQCNNEMCWCLETGTHVPEDGNPVLVLNLMEGNPDCFRSDLHQTGTYMRECEEKVDEILSAQQYLLEEESIISVGQRLPNCQYDGRYSRLMITNSMKFCVDPDGKQLENYNISRALSISDSMDCNCARTRWLMQREGMTELPTCCVNGNFRQMQCRRGLCYCVDCNGNQIEKEVEEAQKQQLKCSDGPEACAVCERQVQTKQRSYTFELKPLGLDEMFAVGPTSE